MAATRNNAEAEAIRFAAAVEHSGNTLNWVIARVPRDLKKLWGTAGQVRVRGTINGFAFRTSLFPTGKGTHYLLVNRAMQKGARVAAGMTAEFSLERDTAERKAVMPAELARELGQERALRKYFDGLNFSTRNDITKFVTQPKSAEARTRRAQKIAERLMAAMLGEKGELPPVLQAAFRQNPAAREGWELMPATKRRFHLFGISGYESPESRAKRVQKAVDEMVGYAERKSGKRQPSE